MNRERKRYRNNVKQTGHFHTCLPTMFIKFDRWEKYPPSPWLHIKFAFSNQCIQLWTPVWIWERYTAVWISNLSHNRRSSVRGMFLGGGYTSQGGPLSNLTTSTWSLAQGHLNSFPITPTPPSLMSSRLIWFHFFMHFMIGFRIKLVNYVNSVTSLSHLEPLLKVKYSSITPSNMDTKKNNQLFR